MKINPSELFERGAITEELSSFLVGRHEIITELANRLSEDTASAVLFGMRGVGKSSIAWQVISLLKGTSSVLEKESVLLYNKELSFECIFHKCSSDTKTVGDLLVDVILGGKGSHSFAERFSGILEKDQRHLNSIQEKFGFDFLKSISASSTRTISFTRTSEEARELLSTESKKRRFFLEMVGAARSLSKSDRLLFVLDEMDRTTSIEGLGEFVKDVDNAQFLFVGVGETISGIIRDHASAGRKLAGNDLEAPPLSNQEIREIFENAEGRSHQLLTVHADFKNSVADYSGGVPWIAQHVGYEAVIRKQQELRSTSAKLHLGSADFFPSLEAVIRVHKKDLDIDSLMEKVDEWGATEFELLRMFFKNSSGISEDEARKQLQSNYKQFFDKALQRIESAKIVSRRGQVLFFVDPVLRLFVKFKIDGVGQQT